jgi:putative endopeptidase
MKRVLFAAAAVAALSLATSAAADDHGLCLDEACTAVSILEMGDAAPSARLNTTATKYGTWGVDLSAMDTSAKPGDSFNRFANGKGIDRLVIPADRTSWGSFIALRELSENRIQALIEELAAKGAASGDEAKVAALYRSFMDEARLEQLDARPLQGDLKAIRAAKTRPQLARLMGASLGGFGRSFYGAGVGEDAKKPNVNVVGLSQSGLGLPDRDYYLDPKFAKQKAAYLAYIEQMLTMAGWEQPAARAADILALETRLAQASWTRTESRNRDKTYNPYSLAELQTLAPAFPWAQFFQGAGLSRADRVIVSQNTAFPRIAAVFAETARAGAPGLPGLPHRRQRAPYLSKRFVDANWKFRQNVLQGQPEQRSRVKRAVAVTDGYLGEPLGLLYTARYFPPSPRPRWSCWSPT